MNVLKLVACILLCESAGVFAAIFTARSVHTWYAELAKPWFNPPGWLFGPTWTILYALMGIALYIVWKEEGPIKDKFPALILFAVQLLFNAAWSFIFFGARAPLLAFIEITALWLLIAVTLFLFWRISTTAGYLLVPYLLWVAFAAILNYSIWKLNSDPV